MATFLIFCVIVNALLVNGQSWDPPYLSDALTDTVQFEQDDKGTTITMDEENNGEIVIAIMTYTGDDQAIAQFLLPPNGNNEVGIVIRKNSATSNWDVVITKNLDYETNNIKFEFDIILNQQLHFVTLHVKNIDDHVPVITADEECNMEELDKDASCMFTVRDEDGGLEDIKIAINDKEEHDVFEFSIQGERPIPENTKEIKLKLGLKRALLYKDGALYVIDLAVKGPTLVGKLKIIVDVIDMPNEQPVWNNIFQSQQFDEKTTQTFDVLATDGDIGINDVILYNIEFVETDWSKYISINVDTGRISVEKIDRDAEELEIYKFNIKACEKNPPNYCITQLAIFIVNDINDNAPIFTLIPTPEENNVVLLELPETKISTIETIINVKDIDLGENARYSLELTGSKHQLAFSIAPNSGYQATTAELFIIDANALDYESDEWRTFSFKLEAVEQLISGITPIPVTFQINLINRNDEIPVFLSCNNHEDTTADTCVVEIEETFAGGLHLITMVAEDPDIDGTVEHDLLGAYANRILYIIAESGEIYTQNNQLRPFDFETQSEVIVQVRATDSLEGDDHHNVVLAQVTIRLIDVNDETPKISVIKDGDPVKENREDGFDIGTEILAIDEDSMADLDVYIDWDKSDGIKNGRKITDTENFAKYKGCVILDIEEETRTGQNVKATLKFKETVPENTPDFEIFDTLDLYIVAIDRDQDNSDDIPNNVNIKVQVYVTNVNDNDPVFTDSIYNERSVTEHTCPGNLIGVVTATDDDVDDEIRYSIIAREGTGENLVTINEKTGELLVGNNGNNCDTIDADTPPLFYLYYDVIATDGERSTKAQIEIYVVDINDINPIFERADELIEIPIREQSPEQTAVGTFIAKDGDRDADNNVVNYLISTTTNTELRNYFSVESDSGHVYVSYSTDQKLDRDNAIPPPPITIVLDARDKGLRVGSLTFTVILKDINNNAPVLETTKLTIGEEAKKDDVIGAISASDADEPNTINSRVNFKILSVVSKGSGKPGDLNMFTLDGADPGAGKVNLKAGTKLEGYFDDYEVTVEMSDEGIDPQQQKSEGSFTVSISRYNFKNPVFHYPEARQTIHLSKSQQFGTPIQQYEGGALRSLEADDQQNNKFPITFAVDDKKGLITILGVDYLTVTKTTDLPTNDPFDITITATSQGNPAREASVTVTMIFVDENITPTFSHVPNQLAHVSFVENEVNKFEQFPEAMYEVNLTLELNIYYILDTDPNFSIMENNVPTLFLAGPLDREEQKTYTIKVQSSSREEGVMNPDDTAVLTIEIEILDVNDNPPEFEKEKYYTIFFYDDKKDTVLVPPVKANDPDDDDKVAYTKANENKDQATNFPRFLVDKNKGEIRLDEDVSTTASGYAILTITASDGDPDHDVNVDVEIYVVSEAQHIVRFKFKNEVEEVEAAKDELVVILMDNFKNDNDVPYEAYIKRVIENTENTITDEAKSICEVYFIDTVKHKPVEKGVIEVLANDVPTYVRLEQQLRLIDLELISFSTNPVAEDNTIEVLRAWLIGVAVVLGTLCVLLIIAFVLKTRSLTKRLNKLSVTKYGSQESGLNRKVVPNTNRHALEGSNPVFSTEKKPEFDEASISSGDSDLIGVENNPDFQQKPERNGGMVY